MADEKTDNCEIQFSSPLGGYGTPDNTGPGVMSGAVSHPGRGTESEAKKKEGGLYENLPGNRYRRLLRPAYFGLGGGRTAADPGGVSLPERS